MKKKFNPKFAFLVHPPQSTDVAKKYKIAKFLPKVCIDLFLKFAPPLFGSNITGFKLPSGEEVEGVVVICPYTAEQIMANPQVGKKKVLKSVLYAQKLGAKWIGLGAFTSIATDGGSSLADKVDISLTSGNAYAAALAIQNLVKLSQSIEKRIEDSTVAVIGAAGSVGTACSKILSTKAKKTILIDKREEDLNELLKDITAQNIQSFTQIPDKIDADFIVTATSASKGILKSSHLSSGTVIIDCAQPHNVDIDVVKNRKDVLVIHSGIAYLPGLSVNMNVGIGKYEVYACLGEALILVWRDYKGHYNLGKVKKELVEEILEYAPKVGLSVAKFRNENGKITEEDLQKFKKVVNNG